MGRIVFLESEIISIKTGSREHKAKVLDNVRRSICCLTDFELRLMIVKCGDMAGDKTLKMLQAAMELEF